jgi:hypothetical protein
MEFSLPLASLFREPRSTEPQCYQLMSLLRPFWFLLILGGRWPLQRYIEDRITKFRLNKSSPQFLIFVLTSFFLILCLSQGTRSIFQIVGGANATRSQTVYVT